MNMSNINGLTEALGEVFQQLQAGAIETKNAEALANIAGKIIKGNAAQLVYYDQRKETPRLPFWEEQASSNGIKSVTQHVLKDD